MKQRDFHCSITVHITAQKALEDISRVSEWWAKNFEGSSKNLGDIFTVRFGDTFTTFKIVEFVPETRVVWQVIDCYLSWLSDKQEWNNTKIEWDVSHKGSSTQVTLTHVGLVPEIECYNKCKEGWTFFATESLFKLMTEDKGLPN